MPLMLIFARKISSNFEKWILIKVRMLIHADRVRISISPDYNVWSPPFDARNFPHARTFYKNVNFRNFRVKIRGRSNQNFCQTNFRSSRHSRRERSRNPEISHLAEDWIYANAKLKITPRDCVPKWEIFYVKSLDSIISFSSQPYRIFY